MELCPVCDGELRSFLGPIQGPVFCNVLLPDPAAARAAPSGTIELAMCDLCGMIVNRSFDPNLAAYGSGYENALHFSAVFREFAEQVARRLVDRYDLRGGRVVEVGCGDGYFLELLCADGGNTGLGFDPSQPEQTVVTANGGEFRIIPSLYGPGADSGTADLVCARHVIEHIVAPREFVGSLRQASGNAALYVEVPDAGYMLREGAFWDVIYEHCCYFATPSMKSLLARSGYEVTYAETGFGGQYLEAEARPAERAEVESPDAVAELREQADNFATARQAELDRWNAKLESIDGGVVLWGAGSKGVTLAAELERSEQIVAAVDMNPRKHGQFMPLTAIPVVSPEQLLDTRPDHVLVMNRNYSAEIGATLESMGLRPGILTA